MASVSYPVSNITAGVSTQEYSLRMDGQASAQSNVLNSPRYGLCKRPNSQYLCLLEGDSNWAAPMMFPLVYGSAEKIYVSQDGVNPRVISASDGSIQPLCLFPSSSTVGSSAYAQYANAGTAAFPNKMKYVRVGDVTFVANTNVQPAMKSTAWAGYTNSSTSITQGDGAGTLTAGAITNDDVWAAWIKKIDPNVRAEYTIAWSQDVGGTVTEYSETVMRRKEDTEDNAAQDDYTTGDYTAVNALEDDSAANALHLAGKLAYQVGAVQTTGTSDWMMQATSLSPVSYASSSADKLADLRKGTSSIIGRYTNQEGDAPGTLTSVSASSSVANYKPKTNWKAGTELEDHIGMAWKTVDNIAELPPLSWVDHTLKVADEEENPFGFYMRFVSDAVTPTAYSHTKDSSNAYPVFDSSDSLTKSGHWEEHCGVGVLTDVDSTTMPHMVVRRPDGSFAFMEAQGSFVVNSATDGVVFTGNGSGDDDYFVVSNFDGGFNDGSPTTIPTGEVAPISASPLVVGDTIEFSLGTSGFPTADISVDTTYYIVSANYVSAAWRYQISETKGGTPLTWTGATAADCQVTLTTYKDLKYAPRQAGDDDTNALPDFFTNPIAGLCSYQDRLGIYTENEITLSGTDDAFNFFRSTVRDLLDSDRLKVRPSQADNESIQQIVPFKTGLIVITNRKQLMIYGQNGALAPSTVTVIEASSAETDIYTTPVVVNDSLYLAHSTTNGGGMYEMYPESQTGFAVRDVSQQIPGFLPEGPRSLQASSKHNMLFWLDDGTGQNAEAIDQENLYVYTWDVGGPKKQQSAWTKWEFNSNQSGAVPDYKIHNIMCLGDRLYMLVEIDSCVTLDYIDLDISTPQAIDTTTKAAFSTLLLDKLTPKSAFTQVISWVGGTKSQLDLPWEMPAVGDDGNIDDDIVIVVSNTTGSDIAPFDRNTTTIYDTSNSTITHNDHADEGRHQIFLNSVNISNTDLSVWVGFKYTMSHTLGSFSPVIGERAVRGRNVFVRGGRMTYSKLNTLAIATDASRTQTISAGGTASKSGEEFFAIHQHINDLSVTLTNDTPWQSMIQGLTYDLNIQEGMNQPVWR
tara:strand:- start:26228 stop:29470 length:3243 start_codon:yes stop_codon:yes gene_type:complete